MLIFVCIKTALATSCVFLECSSLLKRIIPVGCLNLLLIPHACAMQVSRLTVLAAKRSCAAPLATGGASAPLAAPPLAVPPLAAASPPTSSTELGLNNIQAPIVLTELVAAGPSVAEIATRPLCLTDSEKRMVVELAVTAMEELAQVAQAGEPLWVQDPSSACCEMLDNQEYLQRFPRVIGPTPFGLKVEATRETDIVFMSGSALVEILMDVVC